MKLRFDVLGLGCAAVDDLLYVDRYPAANDKLAIDRRERQCGGLTATALVAAARLGARCAYAGVLGADPESEFVLETLRREKINIRSAVCRPGARPVRSTIVVDTKRGTRTIFYDTRDVVGADARFPTRRTIESARVLLVDRFGMAGMIRAARLARAAGRSVVGDFETTDTPRLAELLGWVDHLIVSSEFATRFTGSSAPGPAAGKLWGCGQGVVVVTCGEQGCWVRDRSETVARHFRAFSVKVVDTTGCGDVFHGAYAAALARGLSLEERIRYASAAAALKATRRGGQAGIPTRARVEAFLQRGSAGQGGAVSSFVRHV